MRRLVLLLSVAVVGGLLTAGGSLAKPATFTLVENSSLVSPGNNSPTAAELRSTGSPVTWGAVNVAIPANLKLRQLTNLATDYEFVVGSCWGGSPRFEVWVTDAAGSHKIFMYIGPGPAFTGCPSGVYESTGNLATPSSPVDDGQLPGGTFSDSYGNAQKKYGNYPVTAVYVDADGGWNGDQAVDVDNTQVNRTLVTYER